MSETSIEISMEKNNMHNDDILKHLKKITKDANFTNSRFHVSPGCAKGENFLGDVFRATIEGERDGKVIKNSFIIKCVPEFDFSKDISRVPMAFQREIIFYREIVPIFKNLLQEHGLELEGIPKFYSADDTPNKEVIILEDLSERNYELRDRLKLLDYSHASLALRSLGRFHAYSFALRDKNPEIFKKIQDIPNAFSVKPTESRLAFYNEHKNIVLKSMRNEDPYYIKRVTTFFENLPEKLCNAIDGKLAEPYAVLCHGDSWTNNFLFKYEDEAKTKPTSMYLLDFQICRYASPINDIMYTLFCCCSKETRDKHYKQLLQDYHESLSNCLKQLGCDPEVLFPYKIFQQQLRKFGYFGAATAAFTLHTFTNVNNKTEETPEKINGTEVIVKRLKTDKLFKKMLADVFIDSVDNNYI